MTLFVKDIVVEDSIELSKIKKSTATTTTSLNGTLSLTSTSKSVYIITGSSTGYTVQLPDATTMDIGDEFFVINNSTQTIDLDDNASAQLKMIDSGKDVKVTLIDNSTAAGNWQLENQAAAVIDWTLDQGATNINDNNVPHTSVTTGNPHSVTKTEVGLSNVPNTDATQRSNHTGTQLSSTISDFAATVRSTVLTGLSTATNAAVSATDSILAAIGKIQAQIDNLINESYEVNSTTLFTTTSTTFVDITGFSITPTRAGTYNIYSAFTVSVNSNSNRTINAQIFRNGVAINSIAEVQTTDNGTEVQMTLLADNVQFNGTTDSITARVNVSASTLSVTNRKMIASRKGA